MREKWNAFRVMIDRKNPSLHSAPKPRSFPTCLLEQPIINMVFLGDEKAAGSHRRVCWTWGKWMKWKVFLWSLKRINRRQYDDGSVKNLHRKVRSWLQAGRLMHYIPTGDRHFRVTPISEVPSSNPRDPRSLPWVLTESQQLMSGN